MDAPGQPREPLTGTAVAVADAGETSAASAATEVLRGAASAGPRRAGRTGLVGFLLHKHSLLGVCFANEKAPPLMKATKVCCCCVKQVPGRRQSVCPGSGRPRNPRKLTPLQDNLGLRQRLFVLLFVVVATVCCAARCACAPLISPRPHADPQCLHVRRLHNASLKAFLFVLYTCFIVLPLTCLLRKFIRNSPPTCVQCKQDAEPLSVVECLACMLRPALARRTSYTPIP